MLILSHLSNGPSNIFRIFIDVLHSFVGFRDGSGKKGPNQGGKEDNVRDELHTWG